LPLDKQRAAGTSTDDDNEDAGAAIAKLKARINDLRNHKKISHHKGVKPLGTSNLDTSNKDKRIAELKAKIGMMLPSVPTPIPVLPSAVAHLALTGAPTEAPATMKPTSAPTLSNYVSEL
jgi:hypothetical protein